MSIRTTKYKVPNLLKQIQAFEELIQKETGKDLDHYMGVQFHYDKAQEECDFAYHCDPIDGIEMASTGFDGIHFSFLTDHGAAKDLDHAAIVLVDPSWHEYHVSLVASNLKDFLRLFITTKNVFSLQPEDDSYKNGEINEDTDYIYRRLLEYFELTPFEDPVAYRNEMIDARSRSVMLPTRNGLGVVQVSSDQHHASFDVDEDGDIDLSELQTFLPKPV